VNEVALQSAPGSTNWVCSLSSLTSWSNGLFPALPEASESPSNALPESVIAAGWVREGGA